MNMIRYTNNRTTPVMYREALLGFKKKICTSHLIQSHMSWVNLLEQSNKNVQIKGAPCKAI